VVCEEDWWPATREPSELEAQACWFSGGFGNVFTTTDGRRCRIESVGVWNREAGPDFFDAVVRFDDGETQRGPIELDHSAAAWEHHGHACNPAYDSVVLHVLMVAGGRQQTFTRTLSHRLVPQIVLDLEAARPPGEGFTAHCRAPFAGLPETDLVRLIEEAAAHRLLKKRDRLARLSLLHGDDEALFQTFSGILGYRRNKTPFTLIAQRLPLAFLRNDPARIPARLFGIAGFLDAATHPDAPDDSRAWLAELWRSWWEERVRFAPAILPKAAWQMSGARPANHPQRRLAALACVASDWRKCRKHVHEAAPEEFVKWALGLTHPFWQHHYTLHSKRTEKPLALLGSTRVQELLVNLYLPLHAPNSDVVWKYYRKLHTRPVGSRMRQIAARLFGSQPPPRSVAIDLAWVQQALLQLHEDFCAGASGVCGDCPLPSACTNFS